jgi:hypothetical protein
MLLDSKLPGEYWGFTAQAFVYLKNRSPHAAIPKSTPYEQWFKKMPDLTNIRVVGYPCHEMIPKEKRNGPDSPRPSR